MGLFRIFLLDTRIFSRIHFEIGFLDGQRKESINQIIKAVTILNVIFFVGNILQNTSEKQGEKM